MVSVGTQATSVSGINATVTLNSNLYLTVKSFSAKWGNKLDEEAVGGTDIPIIGTSTFHGEAELNIIFSTENTAANEQFTLLVKTSASTGAMVPISLVWTGKDIAGTPATRTFTLTSLFYPKETTWDHSNTEMVKCKLTGIFGARPTLT
jgi:hypothetical protein